MILSNMDMKTIKKKEAHRSCFSPLLSLCPNLIEKSAPLPIHKPNMIDVIKVIRVKEEPTAAKAVFPKNCPTIKVSAML